MPLDQVDVDVMEKTDGKEMSFFEHLEELRWHLIRSFIAIIIGAILIFISGSFFFDNVVFWPKNEDFLTYKAACWISNELGLGDAACFSPPEFNLITLKLEEMFVTHLKVSVMAGFILAFPYVFWEIWRFIGPGLKANERRYTKGIVFVCSFLFFTGVAFGYFIISPFAITFLVGYDISAEVVPNIQLSSFVSSITIFSIPAGVVFQLPIVIFFLSKIGLVSSEGMKKYRRHAFIAILLLAALITPPDVVTQFFIGLPLYILYELSITIAKRVEKKDRDKEHELTKL